MCRLIEKSRGSTIAASSVDDGERHVDADG